MADSDDVRRAVADLPEVTEDPAHGHTGAPAWKVKGKTFLWERPLGKRDRAQLGAGAPDGAILAARVPDEGAKQALVASEPEVYFTIPHFDGFPAVLVRLDAIDRPGLSELATEAWLCMAPARVKRVFLDGRT